MTGVSIATLTGQNGILTQVQNAKNKTELSSEKEQIELAAQASITKNPDRMYYVDETGKVTSEENMLKISTSEELKAMAPTLGSAFKEDTNNINNGYPILAWQ